MVLYGIVCYCIQGPWASSWLATQPHSEEREREQVREKEEEMGWEVSFYSELAPWFLLAANLEC